jgi:sulfite reductase (NADPH) hemoprotein beta-component
MRALTANRLSDGEVVFWCKGDWVEQFAQADLFGDGDVELAESAEGHAKAQPTVVVDPYLIDLVQSEGFWAPVSYRERIRALGPTNHLHHGKQSEGGDAISALQHAAGAARSTGRVNLIKRK